MKSILQLIIIFTITYLLFSFMKADLNIMNWIKGLRAICCICALCVFVAYKITKSECED